ncbi:MAG: hypothetical protein KME26_04450 [Oscillatoria princeps RMCB-10]|nr:hypothetical protein [Oscillatoria princeps RMCB-10]
MLPVGWPFRRSLADRREAVERLIRRLDGAEIEGKLWVVQGGRILERHCAGDEKDKILQSAGIKSCRHPILWQFSLAWSTV